MSFISIDPYPAIAGKTIRVKMSIGGHDQSVSLQLDLNDQTGKNVAWLFDETVTTSEITFDTNEILPNDSEGLYLLQAYLNVATDENDTDMVANACWPIVVKSEKQQ